ncbi:type II toxin-antitoxin system VapB family antitoxin [Gordonia sp. CPCC 205515]|uniref:type II toxin-antitoxin system VapB family antitoxin n=1 Tax=Gordonia sp. CPCC 205515 TaxID=3140791 RepID=UPI003AF3BD65
MIFKGVREGKPYPDHGLSSRAWAKIPPRQFRLDELTTVTKVLALDKLLSEDSTFYGDLFSHVVRWRGDLYLEDGLHRAVRSALRNRHIIHARMLDLDALDLAGETSLEEQLGATVELPARPRAAGAHRRDRTPANGWTTGWTTPPTAPRRPE